MFLGYLSDFRADLCITQQEIFAWMDEWVDGETENNEANVEDINS